MSLIKSLKISWLPPEKVNQLSFGNVTSHKSINVRTLKPEPGGLFDPRIFGPFLNYECYCGKYKGKENKNQTCERCEVLIAEKNLQRWRMGHISLPVPVVNIALFKTLATNLSKLLGIPTKKLEDIIYLRAYVVIDNGTINLLKKGEILEKRMDRPLISSILQEIIQEKKLAEEIIEEAAELNESLVKKNDKNIKEATDVIFLEDYLDFLEKHCGVKIWTGAEAFRELLVGIDVEAELDKVKKMAKEAPRKVNQEKLKFLQGLKKSGLKLEWMIINKLPIIPCGLRPVTKLKEEDVIATNQHNNSLYRIILRCERLKYYLDLDRELI